MRHGDSVIYFFGRAEPQAKPGAVVQSFGDGVALRLGEIPQAGAFGQILAEQPIGVFVGGALPSVVGCREVDFGAETTLQFLVEMKLAAVVGGDGPHRVGFAAEHRGGPREGFFGANPGKFPDPHQTALSLDDSERRRFATAMHRIDLPVAQSGPSLDDGRTLFDHLLSSQPAAT